MPSPSTKVRVPPNETAAVLPSESLNEIDELANSAFATPPFLIVTAPDDTEKLSELNDALPLADVVASSTETVIVEPAS